MVNIPLKIPGSGSWSRSAPKSNGLMRHPSPTPQKNFVRVCHLLSAKCAEFLHITRTKLKFLETDPDPETFQKLIMTCLFKDTSLVKFSRNQQYYLCEVANRQINKQTNIWTPGRTYPPDYKRSSLFQVVLHFHPLILVLHFQTYGRICHNNMAMPSCIASWRTTETIVRCQHFHTSKF